MSYIEKFIIKNEGYFLRDLKISLYNKEKMKLFLEKKLEYNKIFDIVPLSKSPHIKYLETKDKNVFYNYHNIVNKDPKTPSCNKEYSIERFEKLIKSIKVRKKFSNNAKKLTRKLLKKSYGERIENVYQKILKKC